MLWMMLIQKTAFLVLVANTSQRSGNSCKSSTMSSIRIKAKAERASLMACVAANML